jgi:hypothetical protein
MRILKTDRREMAFALIVAACQCALAAAGNGREWNVGNKTFYGRLDDGPVGEAAAVCDPNVKQLSGYFKINGTMNVSVVARE